jgi:hypothetical protein
MVELAFLTLLNRLMHWGRAPVIVTRAIAADPSILSALVSDAAAQRRLVAGINPLRRPRAYVEPSHSKRLVSVRVTFRGRAALWITWIVTPRRGLTEVDLAAQLDTGSLPARLALALGGRRMLQRHLEQVLNTLSRLAHRAAEDVDGVEKEAVKLAHSNC